MNTNRPFSLMIHRPMGTCFDVWRRWIYRLQLEKFEVEKRTALQNMLMETNKFGLPRIAKQSMAQGSSDDE